MNDVSFLERHLAGKKEQASTKAVRQAAQNPMVFQVVEGKGDVAAAVGFEPV